MSRPPHDSRQPPRSSHPHAPPFRIRRSSTPGPVGSGACRVLGGAVLPDIHLIEGDVLCVAPTPGPASLLLLEPLTWGHPMIGRRHGRGLRAEPSGVPCGLERWRAQGRVLAVWRRGLDRPAPAALPDPLSQGEPPAGNALAYVLRVDSPAIALARGRAPHLTGKPMAIVGEPDPGADSPPLLHISTEARRRGLVPGMTASQARERLPHLALVPHPGRDLRALVDRLQSALSTPNRVLVADSDSILIVGEHTLAPHQLDAWARRLVRQARVPVSLTVAPQLPQALRAAGGPGPNELLVVLPGEQAAPVHARAAASSLATPAGRSSSAHPPASAARSSRSSRPEPPGPRQLALFEEQAA